MMKGSDRLAHDRLAEHDAQWSAPGTTAASPPDGSTRFVAVVGAGFNIQAAYAEGQDEASDWDALLNELASTVGVSKEDLKTYSDSFIQRWEAIVRWHSMAKHGFQPHVSEADLQKRVRDHLVGRETATQHYELYTRLAKSRFLDIISLNFDRRIALSAGRRAVHASRNDTGTHDTTLYRYSEIPDDDGSSFPKRIWYPHGDTKRYDTIKLGVRRYGLYVAEIETIRNRYMQRWDALEKETPKPKDGEAFLPPIQWNDHVRTSPALANWAALFLSAPLVFIGCGLGPDEWPLWWLLNQRARQHTYLSQDGYPDKPPTLVLTAGSQSDGNPYAGKLCDIENIHYESFDAMWESFGRVFFSSNKNKR